MENKKLLELLEIVDMMDTGIRLPAGRFHSNLGRRDSFLDASYIRFGLVLELALKVGNY